MRILFICSEYEGLIKTGGLADACRGLAQSLIAQGHHVTVALPRYGNLYDIAYSSWQSVYFSLAGREFGCAVRQLQQDGVEVALIEHDDFFRRPRPYDDGNFGYSDNPLRFAFFCKAVLEWAIQTGQQFDVIHGHDWQSAAAAYYLKRHYQHVALGKTPFVFTIHNGAYQEQCAAHWRTELDIDPERTDDLNFLRTAITYTDKFNTVSEGYRDELMREPEAAGLAMVYQQRQQDFCGILNGCDYAIWHPLYDSYLAASYDIGNMSGKVACKQAVLQHLHLSSEAEPLFVGISRLTSQKGYDYLVPALRQWLQSAAAKVIIMGTGEAKYCLALETLQWDFPDKFRFIQGFSDALAHQLEAAGDFFLMPSLFEPCGLNQLYSLRYGTLPLVRLTGGLRDTVCPWPAPEATGIGFAAPEIAGVQQALADAMTLYADQAEFIRVQQRGMQQNFSWQQSAQRYVQLYQQAVSAD